MLLSENQRPTRAANLGGRDASLLPATGSSDHKHMSWRWTGEMRGRNAGWRISFLIYFNLLRTHNITKRLNTESWVLAPVFHSGSLLDKTYSSSLYLHIITQRCEKAKWGESWKETQCWVRFSLVGHRQMDARPWSFFFCERRNRRSQ